MKYSISLYNKFERPYYYGTNSKNSQCINTELSSYETDDFATCKQIIIDFLDVPVAELSLDEVKQQFSDKTFGDISEEKLVAIQNYYNGRLALYKTIIQQLENAVNTNLCLNKKYNIPYEYNHFVVYDIDDYTEKQIEAYIEIKVSNSNG